MSIKLILCTVLLIVWRIVTEASVLYDEMFEDTSLEVGKTLSKEERERKSLNKEKVRVVAY